MSDREIVLPVTDSGGITHLVTGEAMAAGRSLGRYATVCDSEILAASLPAEDSTPCRACRRGRAGQ